MKTKKIFLSLLIIFTIASCKNDVKKEEPIIEEKAITFDVTVDVIVKKDDDLIIYYKDGSNEWFDEKHAVWNSVKGSKDLQTLVFSLPEGVLPTNLRLDFSKNPEQEPVSISRIKINYLSGNFELKGDQIRGYFDTNECSKFDDTSKLYITNKDSKGVYDPFLSINMKFYNEMDKVSKSVK